MKTKQIAQLIAGMLAISALAGCFSSSKEVVHDKPVYVNPPANNTTVVEPPAQPATP